MNAPNVRTLFLALAIGAASVVPAGADPPRLSAREAAFMRTVDRQNTANVVTGDLVRFTGTHVAYLCDVDNVVAPGLILGQCGSAEEPMDLFVHLPTRGVRAGDRLRILGVVEPPAMWTDLSGSTVYYAFIKALYVDRPLGTERK